MKPSRWFAFGMGAVAAAYGTYVGVTWSQYGQAKPAANDERDPLLDMFMPGYDVVDRHRIHVAAPADVTLSVAAETSLESSGIIRAIFKGRELILRSKRDPRIRPRGLVTETKSLGWVELARLPGREIVMGAVTKPWEANPVFRGLPPDEFAAFAEPGYVKIVWNLRAEPVGSGESVLRAETRAVATDAESRRKFRGYWSFLSPGIIAIRSVMLPAMKAEAERRCRSMIAA